MLAWYLERGDLGAYEPARLRELVTRACEGGDEDACGERERVDDLFSGPTEPPTEDARAEER